MADVLALLVAVAERGFYEFTDCYDFDLPESEMRKFKRS